MTLIDLLYDGNYVDKSGYYREKAFRLIKENDYRVQETLQHLQSNLSEEDSHTIDLIIEKIKDINDLKCHIRYQEGVKFGMRLIREI